MLVQLSPALRDMLVTYADLERQLVAIGRRTEAARKVELVRMRRRLVEQIGLVGLAIARDRDLARTPEIQRAMERRFTAFRYALGQHQANWPAVRVDEDRQAYADSARAAYAKSDLFWAWCRDEIGFVVH